MDLRTQLEQHFPPIVAILRGIRPREVLAVGHALVGAGIRIIEVPLNSPEALKSIEHLGAAFGEEVLVGAGTVLSAEEVNDVAAAGARLVVSPNIDLAVIERARELELEPMPGIMSPTEAFAAHAAGARHLKLFPGSSTGTAHLRALREVLPADCCLWAVGGVSADNLLQWMSCGSTGVGIGGSLYRPGDTADFVGARADELVSAWRCMEATE